MTNSARRCLLEEGAFLKKVREETVTVTRGPDLQYLTAFPRFLAQKSNTLQHFQASWPRIAKPYGSSGAPKPDLQDLTAHAGARSRGEPS